MAAAKYAKSQHVKNLAKDSVVNDIFAVKFKKPVQEYSGGKFRFELRLGDSTGEIMLKYWGGVDRKTVEKLYDSIAQDSIVHAQGRVTEYNGVLSINSNEGMHMIKPLALGEYDPTEFVRKTQKDTNAMLSELKGIASQIKDPEIAKLISLFFSDHEWLERFRHSPAAMYKHHGYIGGLLEHVLSVAKICIHLTVIHPELDKDLLIAGAILHDIGKVDEFETGSTIKVTKKGMLIGHVVMTAHELLNRIGSIGMKESTRLKLVNMVLSHHGKLEYGSPKLPATPEAMALYFADDMDAKITAMIEFKSTAETEDEYVYSKEFGNIYLR